MTVTRIASLACVGAVICVLGSAALKGGFASIDIVERAILGAVIGIAIAFVQPKTAGGEAEAQ